jgi:arabinofuranosyltransferase
MTTSCPPSSGGRAWRLSAAALLLLLAGAVVRLSWLSDDAFITFRSIENLCAGHGPVWNVGERVQTYTHPLWFLLLAALRGTTGECPLTAQFTGMVLSALFVLLLLRAAGIGAAATVALGLLLGSRTWTSFATSGLETALLYALIAALALAGRTADPAQRAGRVALASGLLATTRLDLILLAGPLLAVALRGVPLRTAGRALALGFAPLAAWLAFATVYYGSPFPVTAYAKAFCHGVPTLDLARQGLQYLLRTATDDPVTIGGMLLGIGLGLARRATRALALGAALYAAYAVKVGGDYMLGRFFLPSFATAVWLLAGSPHLRAAWTAGLGLAATVALALLPGLPEAARPLGAPPRTERITEDGIMDEQAWLYRHNGLLSPERIDRRPGDIAAHLRATGYTRPAFLVAGVIGVIGFGVGDQVHIVDPWLCDPVLMRLPVADPGHWRIGHFFRRFPLGYLESVTSGENRIHHPGLARFYDAMRSVVRDPVWSAARWRHLVDLWTGRFDADLAAYVAAEYRDPPRTQLALAELSAPLPPFGWWFDTPAARTAQCGGLSIRLPEPSDAPALLVTATGDATYTVAFRRAGATLATTSFAYLGLPLAGMESRRVEVPAAARPYDEIWIDAAPPAEFPAAACIGRVELAR